jgi:hypothetical protein
MQTLCYDSTDSDKTVLCQRPENGDDTSRIIRQRRFFAVYQVEARDLEVFRDAITNSESEEVYVAYLRFRPCLGVFSYDYVRLNLTTRIEVETGSPGPAMSTFSPAVGTTCAVDR